MKKSLVLVIFHILVGLLPLFKAQSVQAAGIDPWPWSTRLPFPWETIQGTWTERNSKFIFSFKVIENTQGEKHIKIKQLNLETGEVVSQGLGFENSEHVVVAGMTGNETSQFRMTIRSLKSAHKWGSHAFTGVTIESFDDELLFHFEIRKIREIPLTQTLNQSYKNLRCEDIFE